ncbi:galactokinase [Oceanivirga salmonicida]|uniref:galactokinase n=1 Tax=Oceanivirga salmonicida TaxID=1769291 RepID=UPI00082DD1D1|nr:galactokinase family protein [Oceanivirga salmonicida]
MKYVENLLKVYKNDLSKVTRFENLLLKFEEKFGKTENYEFFSSPGRTEIIGNHTDHNFGKVVCASINLDTIAVASINNSNFVHIISLGYDEDYKIDITDLNIKKEDTWSCILVKGLLEAISKIGKIGGANICITSDVISSAGVSSSASFEMLISCIMNSFFNNSELDIIKLAKTGQYAENNNWNKKSGLLDQIACGYGGMIAIDFKDINNPVIEKLNSTDLENKYDIIITPTGKGHADLGDEYSSIPNEMISISDTQLRNTSKENLLKNLNEIRDKVSDRALLRAMHFFNENERVDKLILALKDKRYDEFLEIVKESGLSSWKYLQNVYVNSDPSYQPISLMLALTENYIKDNNLNASCRVHGGGFAGVIMTVLERKDSDKYIEFIEKYIKDKCYKVNIRPYGSINISRV